MAAAGDRAVRNHYYWMAAGMLAGGLVAAFAARRQWKLVMDEKAVIAVATEYARKRGRNVDEYDSAARRVEGRYWVSFRGRKGQPGDHFTVWVDASTGEAVDLIPGR